MNYYKEIKRTLVKNELYKKVKDYSKNRSDLETYFEVGRLLIEAQGGEGRAKYGNSLIKEYSKKLTEELGPGYNVTSLKGMRQFYLKGPTLSDQLYLLNWSQILELIYINDEEKINYYINITCNLNLSVRELRQKVKNLEYERIGYKRELPEPKVNTLIKNPIVIRQNAQCIVNEYMLKKLILEDIENFLLELGIGFSFIGSEVKIKIGNFYHYMDLLLFNIKFNCYVVVELKVQCFKAEYVGQVIKYINFVDKNIKGIMQDKTIGIIICKKENEFVLEYASDHRIFSTTYKLI